MSKHREWWQPPISAPGPRSDSTAKYATIDQSVQYRRMAASASASEGLKQAGVPYLWKLGITAGSGGQQVIKHFADLCVRYGGD
jgi:hypothetical protein